MKKLVIASAVSALFAAPATVLAQAKPAPAPTLDKVLEASGISVSGYIDAGYGYTKNGAGFTDRVFDTQQNSFALNQFGLTVAKQPKEGFGGLVNVTVGRDAQVIHSFPEPQPGGSMFDITQAYLQYAGGPLTVIAGKFTTLHGTEVIASTGNTNIDTVRRCALHAYRRASDLGIERCREPHCGRQQRLGPTDRPEQGQDGGAWCDAQSDQTSVDHRVRL
jgi:hypothetical protein